MIKNMKKNHKPWFLLFLTIMLIVSGCSNQSQDKQISKDNSSSEPAITSDTAAQSYGEKPEALINKIKQMPDDIHKEFSFRLIFADYCTDDSGNVVTNSSILLGSTNIEDVEKLIGKDFAKTNALSLDANYQIKDYQYDGISVYKGEPLHIKTICFNENGKDKEIIYFMGTKGPFNTYRGTTHPSESELHQRYPKNLYYISADDVRKDRNSDFSNEDLDYAYAYIPDESGCDLTFYIKDNVVKYTEMYIGVSKCRWENAKPVRSYDGGSSDEPLTIETAAEYHNILQIPATDPNNDNGTSYECKLDYIVPYISCGADADFVNKHLDTEMYITDIEKFNSNDFSDIYDHHFAEIDVKYKTYLYHGVCALVLMEEGGHYEAGGWTWSTVWYFDEMTGRQISAEEYARRVGFTTEQIVRAFNQNWDIYKADNVYDADFYVDENGALFTGGNYSG